MVKKGTVNPAVTSSPHGRAGPVQSALGTLPEPATIGSRGGNVGLVDGSVEWRNQRAMRARLVRWVGTTGETAIIGHW